MNIIDLSDLPSRRPSQNKNSGSGWPTIAIVAAWMAVITMAMMWIVFLLREATFIIMHNR